MLQDLVAFCDIGLVQLWLDPSMADPADQKSLPAPPNPDPPEKNKSTAQGEQPPEAATEVDQERTKLPTTSAEPGVDASAAPLESNAACTPETASMVFHLLVRHTHGGEALNKQRLLEAHGGSEGLFERLPADASGDVSLRDWIEYLTETDEGSGAWEELIDFISSDPQWARQLAAG